MKKLIIIIVAICLIYSIGKNYSIFVNVSESTFKNVDSIEEKVEEIVDEKIDESFVVDCLKVEKNENLSLASCAKSAYLIEPCSGEVIFSKNENQRLTIASMTKIMLLNLVFDAIERGELSLDELITVSEKASGMGGSQVFLQANKQYKASDLIKSVIIASANDASVCLSERLFGEEAVCVDKMNDIKNEWGMENTLFSNVTGLPHPTQYSCAKDVAIMLSKLINHKLYFDYAGIYLDELIHPDGQKTTLTNTNKLVRFYNGCDGGKTGYTNEAKFCLGATATKNNVRVIAVVIGEENSKTRFKEVSEMFDYAFNNYNSHLVLQKDNVVCKINLNNSKTESLNVGVSENFYWSLPKGDKAKFSYEFISNNLTAPISKGDKVGEFVIYKNGVEIKKISAVALENAYKATFIDQIIKIIRNWKI